jgi:hypothetical protein
MHIDAERFGRRGLRRRGDERHSIEEGASGCQESREHCTSIEISHDTPRGASECINAAIDRACLDGRRCIPQVRLHSRDSDRR